MSSPTQNTRANAGKLALQSNPNRPALAGKGVSRMATKLTPLHDRIVVRRMPEDEKTAGGIYIPDTAREKPQVGTVIAVGLGRRTDKGERIGPDVHGMHE